MIAVHGKQALFTCILSLLWLGCAQPPVSENSNTQNTSPGTLEEIHRSIVSESCSRGNDQDADEDDICDSMEKAECRGKTDCDGDGIIDGEEDENLDKNPIAVATSYLGSIALAQMMDDPDDNSQDLNSDLTQPIELPVGSNAPIQGLQAATKASRAQQKSQVTVSLNGGKVKYTYGKLQSARKNPSEVGDFNIYSETTYDKEFTVNGNAFGDTIRTIHCVKMQGPTSYDGALHMNLKFSRHALAGHQYAESLVDRNSVCKNLPSGIYIAFTLTTGNYGTALVYTQQTGFAGYLPTGKTAEYAATSQIEVVPEFGKFRFKNSALAKNVFSRWFYIDDASLALLEGKGQARQFLKEVASAIDYVDQNYAFGTFVFNPATKLDNIISKAEVFIESSSLKRKGSEIWAAAQSGWNSFKSTVYEILE